MTENLISCGFAFTKPVRRPDYVSSELFPEYILTLSGCIADFLPDTWAFDWASATDTDRCNTAARFGFHRNEVAELVRWTTDTHERGRFFWPCFFSSLDIAREFAKRFGLLGREIVLLGLGLRQQDLVSFLDNSCVPADDSELLVNMRNATPLPDGRLLGWEMLGAEYSGHFHSWLCNGLEKAVSKRLGIRPNPQGFIEDEEDACRAAAFCNSDEAAAEPVPWYPFAVMQYNI